MVAGTTALFALVISGCSSSGSSPSPGDGGGSGSTTSANAAAGSPAATGDPILIGHISPTDSSVTSYPEAHEAAEIAVRAVNDAGGVKGRPLKLDYCDDQTEAQQTGQCAQKLLVDDKVVALVGAAPGLGSGAVYPVLKTANTINFGVYPNNADDMTNALAYPFASSTGALSLMSGALEQGSGNIDYVTYNNYADFVKQLITPGFAAKGYTVNVVPFDATSSDYSIAAAKAARDKPKYLMVGTGQDITAAVIQALVQAGASSSDTTFVELSSQLDSKVIKTLGQIGVKPTVIIPDFDRSTSNPTLKQYEAEVAKYGKQVGLDAASANSTEAINAWLGVKLFAQVAAQLPTVDGPSLKAYMDKQSEFVTGLTHPLDFTKPGPIASLPRLVNTWVHTGTLNFDTNQIEQSSGDWVSGVS